MGGRQTRGVFGWVGMRAQSQKGGVFFGGEEVRGHRVKRRGWGSVWWECNWFEPNTQDPGSQPLALPTSSPLPSPSSLLPPSSASKRSSPGAAASDTRDSRSRPFLFRLAPASASPRGGGLGGARLRCG